MVAGVETPTLGDLVRDTFEILLRLTEQPKTVVFGGNWLDNDSDVSFTLALNSQNLVNVGDMLEAGRELMLVTDKTSDANPVFTVSRRYLGTRAFGGTINPLVEVRLNPMWGRDQVARAIVRSFRRTLMGEIPVTSTTAYDPLASNSHVLLPADTINVSQAWLYDTVTGHIEPIDSFQFIQHAPPTGDPALALPYRLTCLLPQMQNTVLYYNRFGPYLWSGGTQDPDETETVAIPLAARDLPPLWAVAYLISGREVTRAQVDSIEEWNNEAAIRQGVNLRLAQKAWSDFYTALDEAKKSIPTPRRIFYSRRRKLL